MKNANLVKVLGASALLLLGAAAAHAQGKPPVVTNAEASCKIGEKSDGYLGFVEVPPAVDLKREVDAINIKRRSAYANLAQSNGVAPSVAAQLTAERLINQLPNGRCYQDQSGQWIRKGSGPV